MGRGAVRTTRGLQRGAPHKLRPGGSTRGVRNQTRVSDGISMKAHLPRRAISSRKSRFLP